MFKSHYTAKFIVPNKITVSFYGIDIDLLCKRDHKHTRKVKVVLKYTSLQSHFRSANYTAFIKRSNNFE